MLSNICFVLSVATIALFVYLFVKAIRKNDKGSIFTPTVIAIIGIWISASLALFPAYICDTDGNVIQSLLYSIQHAIRLFVVDDGWDKIEPFCATGWLNCVYFPWIQILFIVAPIVTFSSLLYFFTRVWNNVRNFTRKDTHVFSELNEKTISLAESLIEKDKSNRIIFADIIDKNEEEHLDLVERADKLKAILFRKDIASINRTP